MATQEPSKRVTSLTPEQQAAMAPFAREWIERDLSTGPTDRSAVERGICAAYTFANLDPPKRIVWVDSPPILLIAGTLAALLLTLRHRGVDVAVGTVVDLAVGSGASTRHAKRRGRRGGRSSFVVRDMLNSYKGINIFNAVEDPVFYAVRYAVDSAVHAQFVAAVNDFILPGPDSWIDHQIKNAMFRVANAAVVGKPVRDRVDLDRRHTWNSLPDIDIVAAVEAAVDDAVGNAVRNPRANGPYVDKNLRGDIVNSLATSFDKRFVIHSPHLWRSYSIEGPRPHQWTYSSSVARTIVAFFREVIKLDLPGDIWARHSAYMDMKTAGGIWTHRDFAMVCDRPVALHLEDQLTTHFVYRRPMRFRRLHNERGPAVLWRDGTALWFLRGIEVSRQIVEEPETLSVKEILDVRNAELRRVMIDRIGAQRVLSEGDAVKIAADEVGTLWRLNLRGDEPLLMVQVRNSTPEPIGYMPTEREAGEWQGQRWAKHYYLRVPPSMSSAREAVAWTFAMPVDEYMPSCES